MKLRELKLVTDLHLETDTQVLKLAAEEKPGSKDTRRKKTLQNCRDWPEQTKDEIS